MRPQRAIFPIPSFSWSCIQEADSSALQLKDSFEPGARGSRGPQRAQECHMATEAAGKAARQGKGKDSFLLPLLWQLLKASMEAISHSELWVINNCNIFETSLSPLAALCWAELAPKVTWAPAARAEEPHLAPLPRLGSARAQPPLRRGLWQEAPSAPLPPQGRLLALAEEMNTTRGAQTSKGQR